MSSYAFSSSLLYLMKKPSIVANKLQPPCSKLEQLEQELRSIQKVVNTKPSGSESAWSPPSPLTAFSATSDQTPSAAVQKTRPPLPIQLTVPSARPPEKKQKKVGPTEARVLGSILISGEDIDYYFSK